MMIGSRGAQGTDLDRRGQSNGHNAARARAVVDRRTAAVGGRCVEPGPEAPVLTSVVLGARRDVVDHALSPARVEQAHKNLFFLDQVQCVTTKNLKGGVQKDAWRTWVRLESCAEKGAVTATSTTVPASGPATGSVYTEYWYFRSGYGFPMPNPKSSGAFHVAESASAPDTWRLTASSKPGGAMHGCEHEQAREAQAGRSTNLGPRRWKH
eukprot:3940089-Rhodomonas_salina.3